MRVVFAAGGTGGHLYPAIALADRMDRRFTSFQPLFVGTRHGMEKKLLSEYGYELRYIFSKGLRGKGPLAAMGTVLSLFIGVIQAVIILVRFKPDLVMGFGGYASAAVVIAAWILRRRIALQEQNSIPGITNRFLSRIAARVYLGFGSARGYFKEKTKLMITGNPLRSMITEEYEGEPRRAFGLKRDRPTLLVFGGSQGASSLNRAAVDFFLNNTDVQGIIQTGSREYESVAKKLKSEKERIFIAEYIVNIREAYEAADIVLARAGALSVSEIAAIGRPSILVPYPYSVDGHQKLNARYLESSGGAVMIRDDALDGEKLERVMGSIIADGERMKSMGEAARKAFKTDAVDRIIDDLEKLMGPRRPSGSREETGGQYKGDRE